MSMWICICHRGSACERRAPVFTHILREASTRLLVLLRWAMRRPQIAERAKVRLSRFFINRPTVSHGPYPTRNEDQLDNICPLIIRHILLNTLSDRLDGPVGIVRHTHKNHRTLLSGTPNRNLCRQRIPRPRFGVLHSPQGPRIHRGILPRQWGGSI